MIEWDKSLETGIDKIDQQHRSLIQTLEDLYDACSRGEGMQKVQYTIRFLEWYVEKHFEDEELIQERCFYPDYHAHQNSHHYYINEVKQLGVNFAQDPYNMENLSKVIAYLTKMIKRHIAYEDHAFADYMNKIETDDYAVQLPPEGKDGLTGFMNKEEFCKYTANLLKSHQVNTAYQFAYVVAKIDGFEQVNKSYGYELGDELIIYVSGILHNTSDAGLDITIGRIHRDEFMLLIRYEKNSQIVVDYLERIKEYVEGGFKREGSLIPLSMSMGVVACNRTEMNIKRIHQQATIALDIAKAHNRNQLQWYEETMYEAMREKAEMLRLLQSYNLRQSLFVVFQPIYELENNTVKGAELLLRMTDQSGKTIAPSKFIPLAEENYLMSEIGYFCIEQACKLLRTLSDRGRKLGYVSVNLSVQQLRDQYLLDRIKEYTHQYGVDPKHLYFEIVESMLIEDYERTQLILQSLRQLGCKILLDDFGTGYSSLSYLSRVAIDVVKLDRSFLGTLHENSKARIVFASIITLIKQLDMACIVEGVETQEERNYVEIYGGEHIQGYLMSRPLTIEKIIELLSVEGI